MLNASDALLSVQHSDRVQPAEFQEKLDISDKSRSSVLAWRGQFSPQLVEFLIDHYAKDASQILDPFCGSGTVLFESARHKINAFGYDVNPAAICLAKLSKVVAVHHEDRIGILELVKGFTADLTEQCNEIVNTIELETAATNLNALNLSELERDILCSYFLFLFGNGEKVSVNKIDKNYKYFLKTLKSLPNYNGTIDACLGDARSLPISERTVDYILTSPPYINVFNYHQNYRPATEALGWHPLKMSKSEIGANRKHRQNRYLTVIQYCMDMAGFFIEAYRVLKEEALVTIVLGRVSSVRGVQFKNGELIAAIVSEGMNGKIIDWNERSFLNRFGEEIYEDVITFSLRECITDSAIDFGKSIGVQALQIALKDCPSDRATDIKNAIEKAPDVCASPIMVDGEIK